MEQPPAQVGGQGLGFDSGAETLDSRSPASGGDRETRATLGWVVLIRSPVGGLGSATVSRRWFFFSRACLLQNPRFVAVELRDPGERFLSYTGVVRGTLIELGLRRL